MEQEIPLKVGGQPRGSCNCVNNPPSTSNARREIDTIGEQKKMDAPEAMLQSTTAIAGPDGLSIILFTVCCDTRVHFGSTFSNPKHCNSATESKYGVI